MLTDLESFAGQLANPGLAAIWEDERQRRKQKGESSQISPPSSLSETTVVQRCIGMWLTIHLI